MEAKFPGGRPGLFQHLPHKRRGLSPLRTLRPAPRQAQPPRRPFSPAGSFRPARRQRRPRRREKSCRRLCRGRWTADPAAAPANIPRGRRGSGSIAAAVDKRKGGAALGYEGKSAVSTGPDTAPAGPCPEGEACACQRHRRRPVALELPRTCRPTRDRRGTKNLRQEAAAPPVPLGLPQMDVTFPPSAVPGSAPACAVPPGSRDRRPSNCGSPPVMSRTRRSEFPAARCAQGLRKLLGAG